MERLCHCKPQTSQKARCLRHPAGTTANREDAGWSTLSAPLLVLVRLSCPIQPDQISLRRFPKITGLCSPDLTYPKKRVFAKRARLLPPHAEPSPSWGLSFDVRL